MKIKKKLIIAFFITTSIVFAQETEIHYDSGELYLKGNVKNELKEGVWNVYYKSGEILAKGNYVNDKENGLWEFFFRSGVLLQKGNFVNGEKTGKWKESLNYNENYLVDVVYKNGEKVKSNTNVFRAEYSTGELHEKGQFDKEEKTGKWLSYYKNGKVKAVKFYKNGLYNGKWVSYYQNGEIESIENYKNSNNHGKFIAYFKDGTLKGKLNFINNVEDGKYISMLDKNKLIAKGKYRKGDKVGEWIINKYDKEDNLIKSEKYFDDKLHGNAKYYGEHNMLSSEGSYNNGEKEGLWITYFSKTNIIKSKINYLNGEEHGKAIYYDLEGNTNYIALFGNYINGDREGEWFKYKAGKDREFASVETFEKDYSKKVSKPLKLYFNNSTSDVVHLFIKVKNMYNNWETRGWYSLKPGEDGYLGKILGDDFFIYAESKSSVWDGNYSEKFKGKWYKMGNLKNVDRFFSGKYTINFTE